MEVSVIIPTYNRTIELKEALESIIAQTKLPKEVLIVDDSDTDEVENWIKQKVEKEFKFKGVILKYIRKETEKSAAISRNIGIEHSTGDIILFLDDDVVLDKEYIEEILRIYEVRSNALGIQGYISNNISRDMISKIKNMIGRIFFLWHTEKNRCRVQPSAEPTWPFLLKMTIGCQWLAGGNCSYKREILKFFKFDENLIRYSWKEDIDLSYRIYRRYPHSLYITPHAKLIHKGSKAAKLPRRQTIYMKTVYSLYFFYKNIDQSLKNKLIFLWSKIGELFIQTVMLIIKPSKSHFLRVKYIIESYILTLKHKKEIERGDLEFFNKSLK